MPESAVIAAGSIPRLVRGCVVLLAVLFFQNLIGVVVNLSVAVPAVGSVGSQFSWLFFSAPTLALHVILGIAIFALAIWVLVLARRIRDSTITRLAWTGVAGVVLAGWGGGSFTFYMQAGVLSFVMELGFIVVVAATVGLLYSAGVRGWLRGPDERGSAAAPG